MPGTVLGIGDTVVSKIRFLDSFHFGLIIASVRVCFFFLRKLHNCWVLLNISAGWS